MKPKARKKQPAIAGKVTKGRKFQATLGRQLLIDSLTPMLYTLNLVKVSEEIVDIKFPQLLGNEIPIEIITKEVKV